MVHILTVGELFRRPVLLYPREADVVLLSILRRTKHTCETVSNQYGSDHKGRRNPRGAREREQTAEDLSGSTMEGPCG